MKARYLLTTLYLLLLLPAFSQIETPPRKPFNIGVCLSAVDGVGGSNIYPLPSLDVRYKGTSLRLAPNVNFQGLGLTQEIMPISKSFYNIYWIASGYFYFDGIVNKNNLNTNYNSEALFTGVKIYMGGHFYSEAQVGIGYTQFQSASDALQHFPASSTFTPYFQFGIGYNIFRNYPKPIVEDDD